MHIRPVIQLGNCQKTELTLLNDDTQNHKQIIDKLLTEHFE